MFNHYIIFIWLTKMTVTSDACSSLQSNTSPSKQRRLCALLATPVILSQFICFGDYILESQLLETREF